MRLLGTGYAHFSHYISGLRNSIFTERLVYSLLPKPRGAARSRINVKINGSCCFDTQFKIVEQIRGTGRMVEISVSMYYYFIIHQQDLCPASRRAPDLLINLNEICLWYEHNLESSLYTLHL